MMEKKPIVYIVDDDPSVRKALERLLRVTGYRVETFASPREFLDCRHSDAPGCLILDIRMPGLSGLELQERLADKESRFPIIFVTGHGTIPISGGAGRRGHPRAVEAVVGDSGVGPRDKVGVWIGPP